MKRTPRRPPTMTHEERRRLIDKPFPVVRYHHPHSWAGVLIERPEAGAPSRHTKFVSFEDLITWEELRMLE